MIHYVLSGTQKAKQENASRLFSNTTGQKWDSWVAVVDLSLRGFLPIFLKICCGQFVVAVQSFISDKFANEKAGRDSGADAALMSANRVILRAWVLRPSLLSKATATKSPPPRAASFI